MDFFTPRHRLDGNTKIGRLYAGITSGGSVTSITRVHADGNHVERLRLEGVADKTPKRGEGGTAAVIILGGMEATLDEVREILAARQEKKFVPRKSRGEIARMCGELLEKRNDLIRYYRKNPSEAPKAKRTVRLHLPVGYRMVPTSVPGLRVRMQA